MQLINHLNHQIIKKEEITKSKESWQGIGKQFSSGFDSFLDIHRMKTYLKILHKGSTDIRVVLKIKNSYPSVHFVIEQA